MNKKEGLKNLITNQLKNVYDPEFPFLDLYNMWLIYEINIDQENSKIYIKMTYTTPECPMWDMIQQLVENAILEVLPNFLVFIEVVFDPPRNTNMIKDENIRKMFEN